MDLPIPVLCLLIICARIGDVSIGTIRTIFVVTGRRGVAWILGFFEVLIWIYAVSAVITNLLHPALALSYATGFALGNLVGMTIEKWLAFGEQVVRVFTRQAEMAETLRADGLRVTVFEGHGRDGPVYELFLVAARRSVQGLTARVRVLDPQCFYIVDDIRYASRRIGQLGPPTGWRSFMKRK